LLDLRKRIPEENKIEYTSLTNGNMTPCTGNFFYFAWTFGSWVVGEGDESRIAFNI